MPNRRRPAITPSKCSTWRARSPAPTQPSQSTCPRKLPPSRKSLSVNVGSNVTFIVTATGTLPLSYQWRFNGTNLAYATASAYTCTNAQTTDAGSYSVVVSNIAGTATSDRCRAHRHPAHPASD